MKRITAVAAIGAAGLVAATLAGCGASHAGGKNSITIDYQQSTDNNSRVMDNYLAGVKKQFEKDNPGKTVKLNPIRASENDYYTKVELAMRSAKTAPDMVYEDTFLINSDIKAGYLRPLDSDVAKWDQWSQFQDSAKNAVKAQDGKTYGVPDGTDTRALWYNKQIFANAGLPVPWHPKSWADIMTAANTIKSKVPGVTPLNVYTGKGGGEQSTMQGFEMLLYGTNDQLYNAAQKKWVVGSKGFSDAMNFVKTVYADKLGPTPSTALDPNVGTTVQTQLLPEGKLGIDLDGSWMNNAWAPTGAKPWPQWNKVMGYTPMPTQTGGGAGQISMSGGWSWAIPSKASNPSLAFDFIKTLQIEKNATAYDVAAQNITVRKDVAKDPTYLNSSPTVGFFTDLVKITKYRPALPAYPKISTSIQEAMESVTTGGSVSSAVKTYDTAVKNDVGASNTTTSSGS